MRWDSLPKRLYDEQPEHVRAALDKAGVVPVPDGAAPAHVRGDPRDPDRTRNLLEDYFAWAMEHAGLPLARREFKFARKLGRKWRFDFAWPERMVAAEVEGGTWVQGRHVRPQGFEKDCEKYNAAAVLGWRVVRFTAAMVRDGRAVRTMLEIFASLS